MEDKEDAEEAVEDVVDREHLDQLSGLSSRGVNDPGREDTKAGVGPCKHENDEGDVTTILEICVSSQLSQFHPVISKIMNEKHQGPHPVHVVGPTQDQQG